MSVHSIDSVRMDTLSSEFNDLSKSMSNHKQQCLLMYAFNSFKELCANAVQIEATLNSVGVKFPAVSTLADFLDFCVESDADCGSCPSVEQM